MPVEHPELDPSKLLDHLNREVYGQKWAKEKLTDALAWNQKRLRLIREGVPGSELPQKANVLFVGPTGCGKTFLASTAAKLAKLPYYYTTATEYSAPGYTGRNLDSMIGGLLEAAGGCVTEAEQGIIFIDEVDKIRRRHFGGQDDVGGESVQQGLLTMLEGACVTSASQSVDTSGITFVAGGAFSSLSERIGPEGERHFEAEELIRFGLIPEFIGRFPLRVGLSPLSAEDLRRLLLECQSSTLFKTKNLFQRHGIELVVDDAVIDSIIERARRMGTGARSLDELVKDRCLGLMSRITELPRRGVKRVILREDGVVEEKGSCGFQPILRPRMTSPARNIELAAPPVSPLPPSSEDLRPASSGSPTPAVPAGEVSEEQTPMTLKAWVTVLLVVVLLALGFGAYRSSPASGVVRPAGQHAGEETPRIWREVQRNLIPK